MTDAARDLALPGIGTLRVLDLARGPATPVILVPGLLGRIENWSAVLPSLQGRRVVALDLPGFGASSRPDAPYDAAFFRDALVLAAQSLGLSGAIWVGHSLGGRACLSLASSHPEMARALVLLAPAARRRPPFPFAERLVGALLRTTFLSGRGADARFREGAMRSTLPYLLGDDRACADDLLRMTWPYFAQPDAERTFRVIERSTIDILAHPLAPELLRAIRCPVRVAWGERDRVVPPAEAGPLLRDLPSATLQTWAGAGHVLMCERPAPTAELIRSAIDAAP